MIHLECMIVSVKKKYLLKHRPALPIDISAKGNKREREGKRKNYLFLEMVKWMNEIKRKEIILGEKTIVSAIIINT